MREIQEKRRAIMAARQLSSVMNQTKWAKLFQELAALHSLTICVRYKQIDSDELFGFSPVWWDQLLEQSAWIEWLDIDPIIREKRGRLMPDYKTDRSENIITILKRHNIHCSLESSYFRVWGYIVPDSHPLWVNL
ncbi:DUF6678 family protein [Aeromonas hydrophila]|uniref:DUF6678 family protein n=1 Tax=Aeromonas hydrophila TaxID=644 RepID=UPI00207D14E7|nr:DUF6678 family protein [Aeromonas hydrophila]MCO4213256.1 hypothetical protein [Aeromonas hydrophila]HDX8444305.1 hypothetical protein [Aeromonas hydrophila]HDX8635280.1 hypothetical protein [Aeromonas hydrophila]